MRINLNVPFSDIQIAKRRGAKWDGTQNTWYVVNQPELDIFRDWMPNHLMKPTKSEPLKHPLFKVVQPRTPRKNTKRR